MFWNPLSRGEYFKNEKTVNLSLNKIIKNKISLVFRYLKQNTRGITQAIRTLKQLAKDESPSQKIKFIIESCFYMDDLLHGGDTIQKCQEDIKNIQKVMAAGGFLLSKWATNDPRVFEEIPEKLRLTKYLQGETTWKTLGLIYNPALDSYSINIKLQILEDIICTKRDIIQLRPGSMI